MLSRINILGIISDHFRTLRTFGSRSTFISGYDFALFVGIPLVTAIGLVKLGYKFDQQVGNLIAAISIFGGFLFNLLAIIYGQMDKIIAEGRNSTNRLKSIFIKEIHSNISFCIVLSILIVLLLLLTTVDFVQFKFTQSLKSAVDGAAYFLMVMFLLTLLMVLNRVYILLKRDSYDLS